MMVRKHVRLYLTIYRARQVRHKRALDADEKMRDGILKKYKRVLRSRRHYRPVKGFWRGKNDRYMAAKEARAALVEREEGSE